MDRGGSKLTLISALLLTAIAVATVYMTQPLFNLIADRFSIPSDMARYSFTWPLFTYAGVFFIVGPLSDRIRASQLASFGGIGLTLLLYAASQPNDFSTFTIILALSAAFAACIPAAAFAFIARNSAPRQLGFYFGLAIASTVIGVTLGRTFGAVVAGNVGISGLYKVSSLIVGLATFALVATRTSESVPPKAREVSAFVKSTIAVLGNVRVSMLIAIGMLLFIGYLGTLTFLTFYLQQPPFSMAIKNIGWISIIGLIAVVGAPLSGFLSNRFSPHYVAIASLIIVAVSIIVMFVSQTVFGIGIGLILMFFGVFACQPSILVILSGETAAESKGAVSSFYLLSCLSGGGISTIILGPFWSHFGWGGVSLVSVITVTAAIGLVGMHRYLRSNRYQ